MTNKHYVFIDYLKTVAVLLVINSHFESLYPIPALATGGAMGNALFFIVSGFCLWPISDGFGHWIYRKYFRLYLPALLTTIVLMCTARRDLITKSNILPIFIWPTLFWFVGGMFLLYIIYYIFRKIVSTKCFSISFFVICITYIIYYLCLDTSKWVVEATWTIDNGLHNFFAGSFKLIYYFAIMLIGKYIRINSEKIQVSAKTCMINVLVAIISLYTVKYTINHIPYLMHLQFLNQISVMWFAVSMMLLGLATEKKEHSPSSMLDKIVRLVSSLSLELYIVQGEVIALSGIFIFPLNIIVALCFTFLLALVLHKIVVQIERKLHGMNRNATPS